jgi:hypothetical protein
MEAAAGVVARTCTDLGALSEEAVAAAVVAAAVVAAGVGAKGELRHGHSFASEKTCYDAPAG